ncbi:MAG: hypothetical protein PHT44_02390 [Candidatus Portnoybacteria bacterium]|nr:hypothetical protein [Candidatus Portnoybacteria bacterium]MDD4982390.1 hypothetical protein [Candidatus Portnoybacteria bacterium]
MILPDKNIKLSNSLIGVGSVLLGEIRRPCSVSSLWEKNNKIPEVNNFEKFVLTLDLLHLLDLITIENNLIKLKHDQIG